MGGWFRVSSPQSSPPLSKHDQQDCAVKEENPCSLSTCVFVFRVSVLLLGAKWKFWWNMKTFIFSQFQTLRPCEAVSAPHWRAFAAMENCKKKIDRLSCCWDLIKLPDTVRITREPSNIPSCSHRLRFYSANEASTGDLCLDLPLKQLLVFKEGHGWK